MYHFAGIVGMQPSGLTLRKLWQMAVGRIKQRRFEMVELAKLAWSMDQIDIEEYLCFGIMESTGAGGPVQLSPELQKEVDEKIAKIREEKPGLVSPVFGGQSK